MSSSAGPETNTLHVELVTRPAYRLRDGDITADRERALAELRRARSQSSDLVRLVSAGLLRLPESPPSTRPTPSRAAFVRRLVEEGLLPAAVGEPYIVTGVVPDAAWEQVRRLIGLLELHSFKDEFWAVYMSDEIEDARLIAGYELPTVAVLDALNRAITDRWEVVGVERLLDDDWFSDAQDETREEIEAAVSAGRELELLADDPHGYLRGLRYHLVRAR